MDTRREFLKKAALLAGGAGWPDGFLASIQKALAIAPAPGSTYLDAEHVVILMQENRSFDHCYGALRGVRGFNDPRAIELPNKNRVWLQTNKAGETFAPFRLNLHGTKATWMSSLPHSWANQVDARNEGKFDRWLDVKKSGQAAYAHMPLTMGYYDRQDIPFYYALADAFTICDQNFCSSLTGTTPNRSYLWSGTIREAATAPARVRNEELDYDRLASWTTFPERLEENGISWRVYQNEINLSSGLTGDAEAWLSNFSDNPLEWFAQYNVKFAASYQRFRADQLGTLPGEIASLEQQLPTLADNTPEGKSLRKTVQQKKELLQTLKEDDTLWHPDKLASLTDRQKALHQKAFTTNASDPHYRELTRFAYQDGEVAREMVIPKGDVLHQFRADVQTGQLPTVSWVVAPENFSDHPGAPWYGAWYMSEMIDSLTQNPAVWQKTIFILAYDENDGYFDHVPPFVPPHPNQPETGKTSPGIDTLDEHVSLEQELARPVKDPEEGARASAIGLGYRVPLVIASPWSRGGYVNSEVFDHTSILQFLEGFLSQKSGKSIRETNISTWRRTVCGDLTSVFRPYRGEAIDLPSFVPKASFIAGIHQAKFKDVPSNFRALHPDEIALINQQPASSALMAQQEAGLRPACALPYQLRVDGRLDPGTHQFHITFMAQTDRFGAASAGSPFMVYDMADHSVRNYAVAPGDRLSDAWTLPAGGAYHLRVYGPNGFFREFRANAARPTILVECHDVVNTRTRSTELVIRVTNMAPKPITLELLPQAYKQPTKRLTLGAAGTQTSSSMTRFALGASFGWYDVSVRVVGDSSFDQRYAGRVETGADSFSDPVMARVS
ncbi:phosphocholine-specific phospholipase C [Fibrella arboris]|uniref:phosphocholine-specific phospholipase C n=1 Tax=Fibrella arboris TaxID=3242486 RepID=UPI00351FE1C6